MSASTPWSHAPTVMPLSSAISRTAPASSVSPGSTLPPKPFHWRRQGERSGRGWVGDGGGWEESGGCCRQPVASNAAQAYSARRSSGTGPETLVGSTSRLFTQPYASRGTVAATGTHAEGLQVPVASVARRFPPPITTTGQSQRRCGAADAKTLHIVGGVEGKLSVREACGWALCAACSGGCMCDACD